MRTQLRGKHQPQQKYISWPGLAITAGLSLLLALGILFWIHSSGHFVAIYWYLILPIIAGIGLTLTVLQRLIFTSLKKSAYPSTPPDATGPTIPCGSVQELIAENSTAGTDETLVLTREETLSLLRKINAFSSVSLQDNIPATDLGIDGDVYHFLNDQPFALEVANAYMREAPCGFSEYIEYYQKQRTSLLKDHRSFPTRQLESAIVACTLTLKKVEESNPTAPDLLRLLGYLFPDNIPEEIIMLGASQLGDELETMAVDKQRLEDACRLLQRYSLIHRDTESRTFSVDYLMHAVLESGMKRKQQRQWAEYATRAVCHAFPPVDSPTWERSELFLPQALACITNIDTWKMTFPEAVHLINQVGHYFEQRGLPKQAGLLYQQALSIREKTLDPSHPFTAASLNNLATFYDRQGKYEQAGPLYQKALAIYEKVLGPTHPTTALVAQHYERLQEKIALQR